MSKAFPTNTKHVSAQAACLSGVAHNAFTATGPALRIQPTRVSKARATRINREASLSGGPTNSQKAPR